MLITDMLTQRACTFLSPVPVSVHGSSVCVALEEVIGRGRPERQLQVKKQSEKCPAPLHLSMSVSHTYCIQIKSLSQQV